jgi:phospholipase/carboxylesterase
MSEQILDGPGILPANGQPPTRLVVLLHGLGSNGDDLIGLAPYYQAALPQAAFFAPNAPEPCEGAPGGYQWWGIRDMSLEERQHGANGAAAVLDATLDNLLERFGLTEAQLALVGFSQGTMMALQVGPRRPRQLAGIVAYSGMLVDPAGTAGADLNRPPVLLVHGDADPVVPFAAFEQAKAVLSQAGYPLTIHVSPGVGHSIDPDGLRLGTEFLGRVLA